MAREQTDSSAGPRLLGPAEVRLLADELGLRPTKQRGQNFVIDPNTVRRIVRVSGVTADDVVLEVGPGLGSLTLALLGTAARVVAVEVDPVLAARAARHRRDVRTRRRRTASRWSRPTRCGSPTCRARRRRRWSRTCPTTSPCRCCCTCWQLLPSLRHGLVMVQAEVADRLAAPPGSRTYGVPSVKAAWFADVRRAGSVGRSVFWPAPNVDSGLVAWTHRDPPPRHRHPRAGVRGRRRGVRAAPQDAALDPQAARRLRGGGRGRAGARRCRPDGARGGAATSSSSRAIAEGLAA